MTIALSIIFSEATALAICEEFGLVGGNGAGHQSVCLFLLVLSSMRFVRVTQWYSSSGQGSRRSAASCQGTSRAAYEPLLPFLSGRRTISPALGASVICTITIVQPVPSRPG